MEEVRCPAARVEDEVACSEECATHEDDALYDITPDDGLDATHRAINNGDDGHHDDADVDIDAGDGSHRQRGQEEHQRHSCHHEHDEQHGGHQADGIREAVFEVFVGRRDVQSAEERQEILDDGERHDEYAHLHGVVGPVGHIGLCGYRHIGDGREHRREDADACRPPRDAVAALKEVVGACFAPHEVIAEQEHRDEICHQHQVVQPTELGGVADGEPRNVGSAHARLQLTIYYIIGVGLVAFHHSCAGTRQPLVGKSARPGTRDGVVDE